MSANNSQVSQVTDMLTTGQPPAPADYHSDSNQNEAPMGLEAQVANVNQVLAEAAGFMQPQPTNAMQAQEQQPQQGDGYLPSQPPPDVMEIYQHKHNWQMQAHQLAAEMKSIDMPTLESENPGVAHRLHQEADSRMQALQQYGMQIKQADQMVHHKYAQEYFARYWQHLQKLIPAWKDPEMAQAETAEFGPWLSEQGHFTGKVIPAREVAKLRRQWLKRAGKGRAQKRIKRADVIKHKNRADAAFAQAEHNVAQDLRTEPRDQDGRLRVPAERIVAEALRNL